MKQKLGAFICWNMSTFGQTELAVPNIDPDTFAPTGLNIDQWLDACVTAGMKYAILTCVHHDGFALWPTSNHVDGYDPYSIAQTTWYVNNDGPDVVDLFTTKCRARNINPVLYMSVWDRTYETRSENYPWLDSAAYTVWVKNYITELLTNYGEITAIWLDGWINVGYATHIPLMTLESHVKSLQPNCLMITNNSVGPNYCSEIDIYDGYTPPTDNTRYAEWGYLPRLVDPSWFYHSNADQSAESYNTASTVNSQIAYAIARNTTFAMDLQPTTAGVLTAAQIDLLSGLHV